MKNATSSLFAISFLLITFFSLEASAQSQNASEVFPKGEAAPAKNFTGKVWLYPLAADDKTFNLVMGSVTFEKGARSNWHGASKQSPMTHVAVNPNTENGVVTWLLPVTDSEYDNLKN